MKKKIKINRLEMCIWILVFVLLNGFGIFFIVIYCWIDKNALWLIMVDKIIFIDSAAFFAIGNKNGWKMFGYFKKMRETNTNNVNE